MKMKYVFETEKAIKHEQEMQMRRHKTTEAFRYKPDYTLSPDSTSKDEMTKYRGKSRMPGIVKNNIVLFSIYKKDQNKGLVSIVSSLSMGRNSNKGKIEIIFHKCRLFFQSNLPRSE